MRDPEATESEEATYESEMNSDDTTLNSAGRKLCLWSCQNYEIMEISKCLSHLKAQPSLLG